MKRIFVTGGHFAPAKAVIEELIKSQVWEIYYLGRQYSMEDSQAEALEYQEIKKIPQVNYLVITTGRIQPKFFVNVFQSVKSFLKIFVGSVQSFYWIINYHPDVVLSFGGYVAIPVVFWAWVMGIPIATHEQTVVSGRANWLIAKLADKVLVSWPDSLAHFSDGKTVLTGNPLRSEIVNQVRNPKPKIRNLVFVTGGNQGAHAINAAVEEIIPQLTQKYWVIHQTGDSSFHDYERLKSFSGPRYQVERFFTSVEMAVNLAKAGLVISRSGANTVTEIMALRKRAILIPIPWSNNDEQRQNAQAAKKAGLAEILPQRSLTGETLWKLIQTQIKIEVSASDPVPLDGARRIVEEVTKLTTP